MEKPMLRTIGASTSSSAAESFIEATERGNYAYYLTKEDIYNVARVGYFDKYAISDSRIFRISSSAREFEKKIREFKEAVQLDRLTLIVQFGTRDWGTFVLLRLPELRAFFISTSLTLPIDYSISLQKFSITFHNFAVASSPQSSLFYEGGLQALEYGMVYNYILDNYDHPNIIRELEKHLLIPHCPDYYRQLRHSLAEMLSLEANLRQQKSERPRMNDRDIEFEMLSRKHFKVPDKINIDDRLKRFVKFFLVVMQKKIAASHVIAREEVLTVRALKQELATGAVGAAFGLFISQGSILGTLPSLVASTRIIGSHYFLDKTQAKKITRIFSTLKLSDLNTIFFESAVKIFVSYEAQFMQVTDNAGDLLAMEKLAEDAAIRIFNYINKVESFSEISVESMTKGVIWGDSEKYFNPRIQRLQLNRFGSLIGDYYDKEIYTADFYQNVGLSFAKEGKEQLYDKVVSYLSKKMHLTEQYGYRRVLSWEKYSQGELVDSQQYKQVIEPPLLPYIQPSLQRDLQNYQYTLDSSTLQIKKQRLLPELFSEESLSETVVKAKKSGIVFDLRLAVENFTGRTAVLDTLHKTLLIDRTSAIVNAMSNLNLDSRNPELTRGRGTRVSVTGLGGIGKTQLALRYATLYLAAYDNNVIWINCDTEASLSQSFVKLANKLEIKTRNAYGEEKGIDMVVQEAYAYFADRKSLFILDNVENYREIEHFLPKVMQGNKPYVLITSRHQNWDNVASKVLLAVFSEQETTDLVKEALNINDHNQDQNIKQLHYLLQGLPLALQQAIAYIKVQQTDIKAYLVSYREESRKLLNFNFREFANDPYVKTTYITWQVTLRKIKETPKIGNFAIKILESMSFIASEEIYVGTFAALYDVDELNSILALLRSYSMISQGEIASEHIIHRLVQKVINLGLQEDPERFIKSAQRTERLIVNTQDSNLRYHYLFFLLNVIEYPNLKAHLIVKSCIRSFALLLMHYEDALLWNNLYDRIYHQFNKSKYIELLTETYLTYRQHTCLTYLGVLFDYLERKNNEGILDKSEIAQIVDDFKLLANKSEYRLIRVASDPASRSLRSQIAKKIYQFKQKWSENQEPSCLFKRKKRSTHCSIDPEVQKEHKQQRLARHVNQVKRISGFVSTGLFTKDMAVDLLQGEFKSVAINAGLLLSGRILGEFSEILQRQGERLAAESTLLAALALETKTVSRSRLLAQVLKTAAPFVERGTTVYFAYNLYNDIAAYEAGDSDRVSGMVSNGAIVILDLTQMGIEGAEALEFIGGVSAVTGPISETFAALIWLGAESYEVYKGLRALEQQTRLTASEKLIQGLHLFLGEGLSDYLEVRIKNNHLVQQTISFLKTHSEIKRFVFPAYVGTSDLQKERKVDLSESRTLALESTAPNDPSEGKLICASGVVNSVFADHKKYDFYVCEKALGIEYTTNRTGNATLIALGDGNDVVNTNWNTPTEFIIEKGHKVYQGSDKNDRFVIKGDAVWGKLDGGHGFDTIDLGHYSPLDWALLDWRGYLCNGNAGVEVTVPECNFEYADSTDIPLLDQIDSLCKKNSKVPECNLVYSPGPVKLKNIEFIKGRKNKDDIFFLTESRVAVDGRGGLNAKNPDSIYVTNRAWRDPQIVLRANTVVSYRQYLKPNHPFRRVHYLVPSDQQSGDAKVVFPFQSHLSQYFYFDYPLKNLHAIAIESHRIQFNFSALPAINYPQDFFSLIIQDGLVSVTPTLQSRKSVTLMPPLWPSIGSTASLHLPKNAYYVFKEGIELKFLDKTHIYARVENYESIENLLNDFIFVANQIGKSFSIQFSNNQTALIGIKKSEIFTTDCLTESYLIGTSGENVYVLAPLNTTSFFLPEVTLYDVGPETSFDDLRDTLDLRKVIKKARSICPLQALSSAIFQTGNDLVLQLTTDSLFNKACQRLNISWPIASIRFKKALLNEWYQKVDIILEEHRPMDIFYTEEKGWFLMDKAYVFEVDKEIIVLTHQELHPHAEIILLKKLGNITFFNHNETDLILTNAQDLNTSSYDLYTILISQFYSLEDLHEKALTVTFSFLDETLILKDYASQITLAANYADLSDQYRLLTNITLGNRTKRAIQEKWLDTNSGQVNSHHLSWACGIVRITLSAALVVQIGNFLTQRVHFNEQPMLISLGAAAAMLMPGVQAATSSTKPVLPLLLRNKFSIVDQCVKAESLLGWLGLCVNQSRIIYWQEAVTQAGMVEFESYLVNRTENANYFLTYENRGTWVMDLNEIDEVPLRELYFQLPPSFQKQIEQQHVFFIWQQQMIITVGRYMGNVLTLHTPIGNLFKAAGLLPDWQRRDDIHFLSRCWITMQQLLSQQTPTEKLVTLSVGLSEVALLHPRVQFMYTYLTNSDFSKAKPVVRFIADLLQLGWCNFIYLARILEWCFPHNESIWKISLVLQMVNNFYILTGDLSYWYFGMACVLTYLPNLLETVGIPATRCLHDISNRLAQLFIGQSLLKQLSEDEERVAQQHCELLLADERVKSGRDRLKHFSSTKFSFFAANDDGCNQPKEKTDAINTKRCRIQ